MRLYHSTLFIFFCIIIVACQPTPEPTQTSINGQIEVDGEIQEFNISPGSTVQEAINAGGITLDSLDRVEPSPSTVLIDQTTIKVTRIKEEFEVEEIEIPFDQQRLPTELLPEGVERYDPLQKGKPGLREITYRIVFEDGVEISHTQIKSVITIEPQSQIILYGTKQKYSPIDIPGKIIYLSQGNAILIEENTANRVPIVDTGDLDGRIFTTSDDREWLLFTRRAEKDEVINTLWLASLSNPELEVDLQVENIVHFADLTPGSNTRIIYSNVESRQAAPGWQANNNLLVRNFSANGWVSSSDTILETNYGGVYGWWGTQFLYSPDHEQLVYIEPDQIGYVDLEEGLQDKFLDLIPFQTKSDWAWIPGFNWSPDGRMMFTVTHAPPTGSATPEESTNFNLTAIVEDLRDPIDMVTQVGMFAYPVPSPIISKPSGESSYFIAYLQAIFPDQSDTCRYRLMVMDRDGSNLKEIFPPKEIPGISPSSNWGVWSVSPLEETGNFVIAVLYQGDIWLIDPITGESRQVTGDGLIDRIIWK